MKKALTIAGSDSSGGAGIQADLKTFAAHGVFGMSVITAVTAQNTQGVLAVQDIEREMIGGQMEAIFDDIAVDAVKVGMVSRSGAIEIIAEKLAYYQAAKVVVDPVMISKNGYHLLQPEAEGILKSRLLPLAFLLTPNIPEAEVLTGLSIENTADMEKAAKALYNLGPRYVLLKGGHLSGDSTDVLFDGKECHHFIAKRIPAKHTHGTGCTLSSAIAANLAQGLDVCQAVAKAKEYITIAIKHALAIGKGVGPTHHFYALYQQAGMLTETETEE